jgi:hypothetical protein
MVCAMLSPFASFFSLFRLPRAWGWNSPLNEVMRGSILLVAGLLLVVPVTVWWAETSLRLYLDAVPVEATILSKELAERTTTTSEGKERTEYLARVRFQYEYEGTTYESTRRRAEDDYSVFKWSVQTFLDSLTVGETVTAYVDPETPMAAILDRRPSGISGFVILFMLACIPMGIDSLSTGLLARMRPLTTRKDRAHSSGGPLLPHPAGLEREGLLGPQVSLLWIVVLIAGGIAVGLADTVRWWWFVFVALLLVMNVSFLVRWLPDFWRFHLWRTGQLRLLTDPVLDPEITHRFQAEDPRGILCRDPLPEAHLVALAEAHDGEEWKRFPGLRVPLDLTRDEDLLVGTFRLPEPVLAPARFTNEVEQEVVTRWAVELRRGGVTALFDLPFPERDLREVSTAEPGPGSTEP